MTFSDGLPVQFWLTDCQTFNEREVDGINRACWCQPFQCDDEITVQFKHTTGETLYLVAQDRAGNPLLSVDCVEMSTGIYSASFTPEDEDICDEDIQLVIYDSTTVGDEILSNPTFTTSLDPWVSVVGSGADWSHQSLGGDRARCELAGAVSSDILRQDFTEQAAGFYRVSFTVLLNVSNTNTFVINVYNGASLVQEIYNDSHAITISEFTTFSADIEILAAFDRIEFVVSKADGGTHFVNLSLLSLKGQTFTGELAKSDCLSIRESQPESELIEYSNNRNYYGLVYEDVSPAPIFYLRVPCVFFHERFPQEDRALERTTSTVITSSKLKTQRLMQVLHAPDYFHKKLIMALSHHNVEIQSKQWKKEEAYEKDEGDPKYPLKKATVYLTEKNFLARNVI